LQEPWKSQSQELIRKAVGDVDLFIAVSDYYADFMARYFGIDRSRIRTVPLGITLDGHEIQPARRSPPYTIGYFARIAPEKGLHVLADAYHRLRSKPNAPPTRLLAAGYLLNEHRDYLSSVEQRLRDWGLDSEFTYAGAPDRAGKIALIRQMDVFSVPAVYAEPKGLSLLEAMANGVPIVQPRRGAFTEIVQRTGGGLLVAPDEPESLAEALLGLLLDRDRAAALGRAGAEAVKQQHSVDRMAQNAEKVYEEMLARPARA
jgi:glycosyltransferase involved in cell wall biosynthesis